MFFSVHSTKVATGTTCVASGAKMIQKIHFDFPQYPKIFSPLLEKNRNRKEYDRLRLWKFMISEPEIREHIHVGLTTLGAR